MLDVEAVDLEKGRGGEFIPWDMKWFRGENENHLWRKTKNIPLENWNWNWKLEKTLRKIDFRIWWYL